MIKELNQSNKVYRESVQALTESNTGQQNENFHLQKENRDLRDHIEILENVVGAQTYDLNTEAWKDLLTPAKEDASSTASTHNTSNAPPVLLG